MYTETKFESVCNKFEKYFLRFQGRPSSYVHFLHVFSTLKVYLVTLLKLNKLRCRINKEFAF